MPRGARPFRRTRPTRSCCCPWRAPEGGLRVADAPGNARADAEATRAAAPGDQAVRPSAPVSGGPRSGAARPAHPDDPRGARAMIFATRSYAELGARVAELARLPTGAVE